MSKKELVTRNRVDYGTQDKEELIQKIKVLYAEGKSQHDISREIGVPRGTISRWMIERGIKGRPCGEAGRLKSKIYKYNEDYFTNIDTRDKAYILGFIMGDGYIVDEGKRKRVAIELSADDKDHLVNIALKMDAVDRVFEYKPLEKWGSRGRLSVILRIDSTKMSNDLMMYGVVPRKTGREKFVRFIDEDLQWSFIRGYFDADGTINSSRNRGRFGIFSGIEFLEDILNFFKEMSIGLGVNKIEKRQGCYGIYLGKKDDLKYIYKMMYKYPKDIKLERKYEKFSSLVI